MPFLSWMWARKMSWVLLNLRKWLKLFWAWLYFMTNLSLAITVTEVEWIIIIIIIAQNRGRAITTLTSFFGWKNYGTDRSQKSRISSILFEEDRYYWNIHQSRTFSLAQVPLFQSPTIYLILILLLHDLDKIGDIPIMSFVPEVLS